MTGAAVSTGGWAAGLSRVTLELQGRSGTVKIPCEVVRSERVLATTILHVRFLQMPEGGAGAIEDILGRSQAEFLAWQRALAGRRQAI